MIKKQDWVRFFFAVIGGLSLCLVSIAIYMYCNKTLIVQTLQTDNSAVSGITVSAESGFYSEDLYVQITAPKGVQIYYSFNGVKPDKVSGELYQAPIPLLTDDTEQVCVLQIKGFYEDGSESDVITRTYFLGTDIEERYDSLILSMTGDPDDLYGYEYGIFVPGILYDEFRSKYPDVEPSGGVEANYMLRGREAEREVYVEIFSADGRKLISQNAGVRIQGNISRMHNQKSFRLYARKEYDSKNEFDYVFFDNLYSDEDATLGKKYKRLVVRSAGTDYGYGFLRSELVCNLAAQAGFADVMYAVPISVYINGVYRGGYWLESNFDEQYFENRFGEFDGKFTIIERVGLEMAATDEGEEMIAADFNAQCASYAAMDLTVDENYDLLCEFLDVENYLQYFAIENYVGNWDWPNNNMKVYRYQAGESGYREDSSFDGRWRMLLYDVDFTFGLIAYNGNFQSSVDNPTLAKIYSGNTPLFRALMARQDCREYFVTYSMDLMNGSMSPKNVAEMVDAMYASRERELKNMFRTEGLVGGLLLEDEPLNLETVERNVQQIKDYAQNRPQYVFNEFQQFFSYDSQYRLNIVAESAGSTVQVNSILCGTDPFSGIYYTEIPVTVKAVVGINEVFDFWLVNGEQIEDEELTIGGGRGFEYPIEVVLVTHESDGPGLQINEIAAKGDTDYIEIKNLSDHAINTKGYYLSDNEYLYRYALPGIRLQPGETVRFVGEDNSSIDSLGEFQLNFNIKEGEVLTLTYGEGTVDRVTVPKLTAESVYVRDYVQNLFREEVRREQVR